MFERYDEPARRTIFFARYEASQFGSPWIDTEHLLLGLLRESQFLRERVSGEAVRARIESEVSTKPKLATSVDLPLSSECKRILAYGAEEAEGLQHRWITPEHLLLGVFRVPESLALRVLDEQGLRRELVVEHFASGPPEQAIERMPAEEPDAAGIPAPAPALSPLAAPLAAQVEKSKRHLLIITEAASERHLKHHGWTRKQAMGHLIDLATAHHQWFARALAEPRVTAVSYPAAEWAVAQHYDMLPWTHLVSIWRQLSKLLVLVLTHTPEAKWRTPCRIGIDPEIPLQSLVEAYVSRVEDVLAEILTEGR